MLVFGLIARHRPAFQDSCLAMHRADCSIQAGKRFHSPAAHVPDGRWVEREVST